MDQPGLLAGILTGLEDLGIPYALSGSLASSTWGRARATYDADILLDLKPADVDRLTAAFPAPDWYADRQSILEALRGAGEFNLIHGASGTKIDFWIRARRAADAIRFARRRRETVAGVPCWLLSPEDTILAKLEWLKAAPSDRQRQDVRGIIAVQAEKLDWTYLRDWAQRLDVLDLLNAVARADQGA